MDKYVETDERLEALDNLIARHEARLAKWQREIDEAENMLPPIDDRPDRALWSGEALKGTPDESLVVKRDQSRQKLHELVAERERLMDGRESAGNPNVSKTDRARVVAVGTALQREFDETEDALAHFHGSKEQFKEWAGKQIERSASTAYEALKAADCWATARQGTSDGLGATLERAVRFAEQHADLRKR